jgi:hypothetical protein
MPESMQRTGKHKGIREKREDAEVIFEQFLSIARLAVKALSAEPADSASGKIRNSYARQRQA